MYYSLNSLKGAYIGIIQGSIIGVVKEDTKITLISSIPLSQLWVCLEPLVGALLNTRLLYSSCPQHSQVLVIRTLQVDQPENLKAPRV